MESPIVLAVVASSESDMRATMSVLRDVLRDPAITSPILDQGLLRLLLANRNCINKATVEVMRLLLSHGASTLLRDKAGFLLQTNLRAGVIYAGHEDTWPRSYDTGYPHWQSLRQNDTQMDNDTQRDLGVKLHFSSAEIQLAAVECVAQFGANWTRKNHYLFPHDFRQRAFTLLLVNFRMRQQGLSYLTHDPLDVILRFVAHDEFISQECQIADTKALIRRTYASISTAELYSMCKDFDSKRMAQFRATPTPFQAYCKARGTTPSRKDVGRNREFLLDFLVGQEML